MPRTIESLQQVMHGLYPTDKCHPDVTPPLIVRCVLHIGALRSTDHL